MPYGIIPPWGSSAMGFFRGKVCHMVFLQGERLLYGIISGGRGGGAPVKQVSLSM